MNNQKATTLESTIFRCIEQRGLTIVIQGIHCIVTVDSGYNQLGNSRPTELIVAMVEQGKATVEVKREVFEAYNEAMDAEFPKMLWSPKDGGKGYFFNEHGRVITNMPWSTDNFYARVQRADVENFNFG